ncbi:MAG: acylphosphatase [Planctomycetota bacterium]|jgi:acylphosphatase
MDSTAKHIVFTGRVQGVGFRFTALDIANRYNLTGQVRNLRDGTVEMVAQGSSDDISKF